MLTAQSDESACAAIDASQIAFASRQDTPPSREIAAFTRCFRARREPRGCASRRRLRYQRRRDVVRQPPAGRHACAYSRRAANIAATPVAAITPLTRVIRFIMDISSAQIQATFMSLICTKVAEKSFLMHF